MARWKPQEDEFVFYFTEYGNINYTDWTENINSIRYDYHKGLYEMGNVFQTKEQAEQALKKIKDLLLSLHGNKDYSNDKESEEENE